MYFPYYRCEILNTGNSLAFNPPSFDPTRPYGGYRNIVFPFRFPPAVQAPSIGHTPVRPAARPPAARPPAGADPAPGNRNKRDVDQVKTHQKAIIGPQRNVVGPIIDNSSVPTLVRLPRPKSFVLKAGETA